MTSYHATLGSLVGMVLLWWLQAAVAGIVSVRAKHVPGMPVAGGHDDPFFRCARAFANTNENLPAFAIAALAAMALGAAPGWVDGLAIAFLAARAVHMAAYYADVRLLRSTAYVVGVLATLGLAILAALEL